MAILKKIMSMGVLGPNESASTKRAGRFFDFVMLLVMFWLPLQWYMDAQKLLSADFILVADWVVWSLFVLEFIVMIVLVKKKLSYFLSNWLNLIIILALFPPLWAAGSKYAAILRYFRFLVIIRLMLPQLKMLQRVLSRNHFGTTLLVLSVVTILGGIIVTYLDPQLGSVWNGIWWAVQTVTTVGYGDIVPKTGVGQAFGVLLMVLGVGLYSLVSANLAAYFVERGRRQVEKKPQKKMAKEFSDVHEKLGRLEESNRKLLALLEEKFKSSSEDDSL